MLTKEQIFEKIKELRGQHGLTAATAYYVCSGCGKTTTKPYADEVYDYCPGCHRPVAYFFSELCELFEEDTPELYLLAAANDFYEASIAWSANADTELPEDDALGGMELGNLIFGHSRGQYPVDRTEIQDMFVTFLEHIGCDSYGHADSGSVLEQYADEYGFIDTDLFSLFAYYWGDEDEICAKPNFVYKPENIEIRWYKYPMRDSYSNAELSKEKMKKILEECEEYVRSLKEGAE